MARARQNAPELLLGAAIFGAVILILALSAHLTFFADSWEVLMIRRNPTADALLQPHNEHLILAPVLISEVLLRIFGMTSAAPEFVALALFLVATALLVHVYVERRIGRWPALVAAALVLFLGPAYEVLLWPFEISYVGSMLFGLLALLAGERGG